MKNYVIHLSVFILIVFNFQSFGQKGIIPFFEKWKFHPGDNLAFANPDFNDADWKSVSTEMPWEKQGYDNLNGFAWYRTTFFLTSNIRKISSLKDSVKIFLGKIDDFDQVFLNGKLIGVNNKNAKKKNRIDDSFKEHDTSIWDTDRTYTVGADDPVLKWDAKNVIAVRVYDWGGLGGMFSPGKHITMTELRDYIKINYADNPFKFKNNKLQKKLIVATNAKKYQIKGTLSVSAKSRIDSEIFFNKSFDIDFTNSKYMNIVYEIPVRKQSSVAIYKFKFKRKTSPLVVSEEIPYILTPPAPKEPRINGASVYGERAGRPFLFKVPVSGKRPILYSAINLPNGLSIGESSGIIRGKVNDAGNYDVTIKATNKFGSAEKTLNIIIGENIALTPPMGWNSWNAWGLSVNRGKIIAAAKAFVKSRLIDHGWTYINIDDGWEIPGDSPNPKRDNSGKILTNGKFPDMKALGDSIHSRGMKFGIYSSPGDLTCGGYTGSYGYEYRDAQSFADWGIDYLKYDLCGYGKIMKDIYSPEELIPPYKLMRSALDKVNRDIVYSLCEYGNGKVWEWGAKVGGNLWRTTGDITDSWESLKRIGFNQIENAKYAGPGHWNDPDMLVVGWVGWGPNLHPTGLTPDEQYTHISLWALLSAPLLIGCDLEKLDDFTLNLLTNDEVIAVNQDVLGCQAAPVIKTENIQVWEKDLTGGNKAIGIFNTSAETQTYIYDFEDNETPLMILDLWRQITISPAQKIEMKIPGHGVALLKYFYGK